jgi:hypothetical protein
MDQDTQKLIDETISNVIAEQSNLIQKGSRPQEFDICPHCKEEIYEKSTYSEDGGKTFKHNKCGKVIEYPDTDDKIPNWLTPAFNEMLNKIKESSTVDGHLPISGDEKYSKQEPGGQMAAVNLEEINKKESTEVINVNSMDNQKMFDGQVRVVNLSNLNLKFDILKINVDTADAFIIKVQNL